MIVFLNFPWEIRYQRRATAGKDLRPENEPQIGGGMGGQPRLALEVTSAA
jgi:hypothetical protein